MRKNFKKINEARTTDWMTVWKEEIEIKPKNEKVIPWEKENK